MPREDRKKGGAASSIPLNPPALPAPGPGVVQMKVSIEAKGPAPRYHVNHAEMNLTPFEMVITFGNLPARFDADDLVSVREQMESLESIGQEGLPGPDSV
jgi:hypothetical protein